MQPSLGDRLILDAKDGLTAERGAEAGVGGLLGGGGDGGAERRDERGAPPDLALDANAAAHERGEPLADRQAEAGATVLSSRGRVDLTERLEEPLDAIGRDADAGVAHRKLKSQGRLRLLGGAARLRGVTHLDGHASGGGELDRVVDQVGQDLAQSRDVADDPIGYALVDAVGEFEFLGGRGDGEQVECFLDAGGQVDRLQFEVHLARLDLGEVEDVVDDGEKSLAGGADRGEVVALLRLQRRLQQEAGHADDAVHRRADLVRHGGEELALGAGGGVGLELCAAKGVLGFDAGGDVGLDGDEVLQFSAFVANRLDFQMDVVLATALGVVGEFDGQTLAAFDGGADAADEARVGIGPAEERIRTLAGDFLEGVFHYADERLIDPLDGSVGAGDDDEVVGAGGDERQLAGGGLAFAEGLIGALALGDILDRADDADGSAGAAGGREAAGPDVEPAPGTVGGPDAVFGIDVGDLADELIAPETLVTLSILRVDELGPDLQRERLRSGVVAEDGPNAGAEEDAFACLLPLKDADFGGFDGETEPLVGDLEHGFDAASFLVFRHQALVERLGGAES